MTIAILTRDAALRRVEQALWVSADSVAEGPSIPLIAQALRRAVHVLAPCPRHELERAVVQSLSGLAADHEQLVASTDETLESLIAYGDILEMRSPADDPWSISPLVVRPAPPAFVVRNNGDVILLGVAGDEISPLPGEWTRRIVCRGVLRTLVPKEGEDLRLFLMELGLIELSEKTWLHLPPTETAQQFAAGWMHRLSESPPVATIEGLQVLDTRKSPSYYTGRWTEPDRIANGMHIGRRPQRYGSPLWCLVDLFDGVPRHFIDLASRNRRERPCDIAWRIQMALDAAAGAPQQVRIRPSDRGSILDFFSPLPSWAERKLAISGGRTPPFRSLLAYAVPACGTDEALSFLEDYLWLTLADKGKHASSNAGNCTYL
ncbi:hypothetical protein [Magnetospirillum aberrantis]|uniref:Uncharacterized protein n=1 Tax=Magnetospirillum aberrantis SpK TaxID=908842 RepID=A0A7C9UUF8_9PROT|nr:hypothetical protein [Magnetospirillum aberrantis]NFV80688.1 hypothetical protein [Magnetospirillum aberrantis SpK]